MLFEVYRLIGCTKQKMYYWQSHMDYGQIRKSVVEVIERASTTFQLSDDEAEWLANAAGISLDYSGGYIVDMLGYTGKLTELCDKAMVSDRMLRRYKTKAPTKQVILALCIVSNKTTDETDHILRNYGYCLSDCIISDVVIKWFIGESGIDPDMLIFDINETLEKMGLPLLMARQY